MDSNSQPLIHKEYHVSYYCPINKNIVSFTGFDCVNQWFKYIKNTIKETTETKIQLYAHNAGFDFSFLVDKLTLNKNSLLYKDGQFYSCSGQIKNTKITLVIYDSLKILQMKLSDIPEFLGNKLEKEIFDYALNTEDNFLD